MGLLEEFLATIETYNDAFSGTLQRPSEVVNTKMNKENETCVICIEMRTVS